MVTQATRHIWLNEVTRWFPAVFCFCFLGVVLAHWSTTGLLVYSIAVFLGASLVLWRGPRRDTFSPLPLILALFVLSYSWQIVLMKSNLDSFTRLFPVEGQRIRAHAAWIGVVAVGAIAAMSLGVLSEIRPARHVEPGVDISRERIAVPHGQFRFLAVTLVGVLLTLAYTIVAGGLRTILLNLHNRTQFLTGLNYLASGPLVIFAAAFSWFAVAPRSHMRLHACFLGISILLTFLTGSKANVALELGAIAIIFHYRVKRLAVPVLLLFFSVSVLGLTMYQLYFRSALPRGVPIEQVIAENGGLAGVPQEFAKNTFFGAQALGVARDQFEFPSAESFGRTYVPLLSAPIPHSLYRTKPDAFAETFTKSFAPDLATEGTTYPATGIGEFYVTGGVLGAVLGSLLVGVLVGYVYSRREVSTFGLARYALILPLVPHFMRGESYGIVVLGATLLVPTWFILRGTEKRRLQR